VVTFASGRTATGRRSICASRLRRQWEVVRNKPLWSGKGRTRLVWAIDRAFVRVCRHDWSRERQRFVARSGATGRVFETLRRERGLQAGGGVMLTASLSFRVQPHKRAEALSAIDALVERMRLARGCGRSRVLSDVEDSNAFTVASEWSDTDSAEAFFQSREFQIFRGIRILLREEPTIVLDDVRARVTRLVRNQHPS
jgi:quinol monooxygenase YgiN